MTDIERTPSRMDKVADWGLRIAGLWLIAILCLSVYNVFSRYLFNRALLWADEVTVLSMIALVWLGAIISAWHATEIRMDILANMLPKTGRKILLVVQEVAMVMLLGWVSYLSFQYVARAYQFNFRSDALRIPMWLIHAAIPVSLSIVTLIGIYRLVKVFSNADNKTGSLVQKEIRK